MLANATSWPCLSAQTHANSFNTLKFHQRPDQFIILEPSNSKFEKQTDSRDLDPREAFETGIFSCVSKQQNIYPLVDFRGEYTHQVERKIALLLQFQLLNGPKRAENKGFAN